MKLDETDAEALVARLDSECWSCTRGGPAVPEDDGTCAICHGVGFVTTAAGNALLEFLARHGIKQVK